MCSISYQIETFDEAMVRANRLREHLPAVYNAARLNEQPIPLTQSVETVNNDNQFGNLSWDESMASENNENDNHGAVNDEENSLQGSTLSNLFDQTGANEVNHASSSVSISSHPSIAPSLSLPEQNNGDEFVCETELSEIELSENGQQTNGVGASTIVKRESSSIVVNTADLAAFENIFNGCNDDDLNEVEPGLDTPNSAEFDIFVHFF